MAFHSFDALPAAPRALLRACHGEPALAVTAFTTALAAAAGLGLAGTAVVGAAVLAGQLSVGWCNDAVDAARDTASGRRDKPVATGELPPGAAGGAAVAALVLCVPLSFLAGPVAGAAHLGGVAAGWAYDLGLKRTVLSPLTYAAGFASLPAFVTLSRPSATWPQWWAVTAAALLGVGAHMANVLPDIADDLASGVRGLPQRLGHRACRRLAPALMLAAVIVLTAAPAGPVRPWGWALGASAAAAALTATALPSRSAGRWPFRAAMLVAALAVTQLLLRGADMG